MCVGCPSVGPSSVSSRCREGDGWRGDVRVTGLATLAYLGAGYTPKGEHAYPLLPS